METDKIKATLREYILSRFLKSTADHELKDSTPLISGGIIDSISTMQMIAFLEKEYHFEFEAHEVDRDNLDTIEIIAGFVQKKING
jgi:acyl carrier protein